ncbi:MAG: glutamate racemase, partial [Propionibacteriaceae bacterium]
LVTQPCPLFVPYVEKGMTSGPELERIARDYLATIQQAECDTLILGCTHYPLLEGLISYVLDDGVTLVTSSEACAAETYRTLVRAGLTHNEPRKTSRRFLTTGDPVRFELLAQRLFSGWVSGVEGVTVPARRDA